MQALSPQLPAMDHLTGAICDATTRGTSPQQPRPQTAENTAQSQVAGSGYHYSVSTRPGRLWEFHSDDRWLVGIGAPYAAGTFDDASEILAGYFAGTDNLLANLGGEFALACFDVRQRTLLLATDLFGSIPLYYAPGDRKITFGTDLNWVTAQAGLNTGVNPQALYDYLFFSVVPGNRCIRGGIEKVPPASVLTWQDGRTRIARSWKPSFGSHGLSSLVLRERTIAAISASVGHAALAPDVGCFLSGGLDSSTVCGMAAAHIAGKARAFTIGFDVPQYDETRYARITAEHFGLELHEHRITSRDVAACVEQVIRSFPEPFGNPSALPAYLCAKFAHEAGIRHMIAGDGGDELFAGNERYQKQALFNQYHRLPTWARHGFVDPLAAVSSLLPGPLHKLARYVDQAKIPLPDRLFTYNLLARNNPETVLTKEFLSTVDVESPYRYARNIFETPEDGDSLDRMLFLDWTTTLTDNDLIKVGVGCALAGITPHYPLLDPGVVEVSTRIPTDKKMGRSELRKFYKQTFRSFLPPAVLRKQKHGFGVPVGMWINTDETLRELFRARLTSLEGRGIVQPQLLSDLLTHLTGRDAPYYGALMWPLFALEEWLQGKGL